MGLTIAAICSLVSFSWTEWGFSAKVRKEGNSPAPDAPAQLDPQAGTPVTPAPLWTSVPGRDFDFLVLSAQYHWEKGKTAVLGPDGRALDMAREMDLLVEQWGRRYGDLIAVGTASCEGDIEEENDRAEARADHLVALLRGSLGRLGDGREIHTLNLGKFRHCGAHHNTLNQRRIVLAAEKTQNCPADLRQQLLRLFQRKRPGGLIPDEYSVFELDYERSR